MRAWPFRGEGPCWPRTPAAGTCNACVQKEPAVSGYFREEQEYRIKLHVCSVDKCLKRWGFTPQNPIKCA
jgi:hypothetical protein